MTTRIDILSTSLEYSERLEQARSRQEQRNGRATALAWPSGSPPGVHADDGPLEAVIAESLSGQKQADLIAALERTERFRPADPRWYLSLIGVGALHRNKGCGAALLEHGLRECDREHRPAYLWSSNPQNTSLYQRYGFEVVATIQVGSSPPIFPMLRHAR